MMAYFKLLAWFVKFIGVSPDEFVRLPEEEVAEKVQSFCDKFSDEGKKSTALNAMKALRSFLKANKFKLDELELDASYRVMKRPEYVPTKEEVYKMASACDLKWRAILLCLFQSGLRNSALRALTYGMLRDQVEGGAVPIRVHVTGRLREVVPEACKEGVDYWTFFGREACEALRQYLDWRREKYGGIEDDELLFPSEYKSLPKERRLREPMDQWHLARIVKKAARKAGIKEWHNVRAHSLRKTFRSVLDAGYVDGGQMAEDDKEYLMGHKLPGAKEPYHNANMDVLAQRYMRRNWAPRTSMSKEEKVEAIMAFAKALGVKEVEIKVAKRKEETPEMDEILGELMREELGINSLNLKMEKPKEEANNGNCRLYESRIVLEEELLPYLDEGWDIVKEFKDGKIAIRRRVG